MSAEEMLAILAIVLWLLYLDHAIHALRLWLHSRGWRTIRNSFIALMLVVGMTLITAAALNRAWPETVPRPLLDGLRTVLYGMLLTGGVVLAWTWRAEE